MNYYFLFKLHFCFTLYMTGIIWLVQIIHYPLFRLVGETHFSGYHQLHIKRTSSVIAIPMILELLSALYLIFFDTNYRHQWLFLLSFSLLVFIWLVTFIISVPNHNVLAMGFNNEIINSLINTNWLRTIAWSVRGILLFYLLH